jgi:hypothetical protein
MSKPGFVQDWSEMSESEWRILGVESFYIQVRLCLIRRDMSPGDILTRRLVLPNALEVHVPTAPSQWRMIIDWRCAGI